jgi:hypothetical protein
MGSPAINHRAKKNWTKIRNGFAGSGKHQGGVIEDSGIHLSAHVKAVKMPTVAVF